MPETIGDRILKIRKKSGCTQKEFADLFDLSENYIGMMETGRRVPSDRLAKDICEKMAINKEWLKTGIGPMYVKPTREDEISQFFGKVLADKSDSFRFIFVSALSRLTEEDWDTLAEIMQRIIDRR